MPEASNPTSGTTPTGTGALVAIIVAIVLGALVGTFYGRAMWLAGGGPAHAAERLEATLDQKEQLAGQLKADDFEEAARLRSHIPAVEDRLVEMQQLAQQNQQGQGFAYFVWKLTEFCGDIFLQALKMIVVPLVVTSMICGITSLGDIRKLGRMGGLTVLYYLCTTGVAVVIGTVLVLLIRPGVGADDTFAYVSEHVAAKEGTDAFDTLLNVFRGRPGGPNSGMVPSNLFMAAAETNVLGLIVFSLAFGGILTTIGKRGQTVIDFFEGCNEAIMKLVELVMWFAPVGIFGLVAFNIAEKGGGAAFGEQLTALSKYVLTVVLGLLLHAAFLCITLRVLTGRNPLRYLYGVAQALLTALTTSSSSATLPVTIDCVQDNNGVSPKAAGFVLPLGATINMDGTALYEAVAVIFIAQSLGVDLSTGQLLIIVLTATLSAIGAAGIPEAGLVTMVIVLTAVGLPISGIGLILAIDWFLDRLRTTVNVFGDSVGAGIIDRLVVH